MLNNVLPEVFVKNPTAIFLLGGFVGILLSMVIFVMLQLAGRKARKRATEITKREAARFASTQWLWNNLENYRGRWLILRNGSLLFELDSSCQFRVQMKKLDSSDFDLAVWIPDEYYAVPFAVVDYDMVEAQNYFDRLNGEANWSLDPNSI